MSTTTLRILIALFLVAHGWVHFSLTTVPVSAPGALHTPFWPAWWRTDTDPTWLASRLGLPNNAVRALGVVLWVAALAGLSLAGAGLLGVWGLSSIWQTTTLIGTVSSLLLLAFYWHPWLVMGVAIDIATLAAIWLQAPHALFSAK